MEKSSLEEIYHDCAYCGREISELEGNISDEGSLICDDCAEEEL